MDKRVSVVMTTYNGQKYLRDQMDSLREQTMPIDEVIIMDDCSTDDTPVLVSAYIAEHSLKGWKLVRNKQNQGWKKNFKSGFDLSTGDYIFPCDQDDIWRMDKIQKMVEVTVEVRQSSRDRLDVPPNLPYQSSHLISSPAHFLQGQCRGVLLSIHTRRRPCPEGQDSTTFLQMHKSNWHRYAK